MVFGQYPSQRGGVVIWYSEITYSTRRCGLRVTIWYPPTPLPAIVTLALGVAVNSAVSNELTGQCITSLQTNCPPDRHAQNNKPTHRTDNPGVGGPRRWTDQATPQTTTGQQTLLIWVHKNNQCHLLNFTDIRTARHFMVT